MSVKKISNERYKVDIRPHGVAGRRIQRIFNKKSDAVAFERYVISHMNDKHWLEKPTDLGAAINTEIRGGGNL